MPRLFTLEQYRKWLSDTLTLHEQLLFKPKIKSEKKKKKKTPSKTSKKIFKRKPTYKPKKLKIKNASTTTNPRKPRKEKTEEQKAKRSKVDALSQYKHPVGTPGGDDYVVYIIENICKHNINTTSNKATEKAKQHKTYVGITNDFSRRIRQHNGVLSGGARYTKGHVWRPVCIITGFPDKISALQCEYRLHHPKPAYTGVKPVVRRIKTLCSSLNRERFTSNQILKNKQLRLTIHWRKGEFMQYPTKDCKTTTNPMLEWPSNVKHCLLDVSTF